MSLGDRGKMVVTMSRSCHCLKGNMKNTGVLVSDLSKCPNHCADISSEIMSNHPASAFEAFGKGPSGPQGCQVKRVEEKLEILISDKMCEMHSPRGEISPKTGIR